MSCPSLLNGDADVPKVTSAKSLGEHIDDALTRSAHIEKDLKEIKQCNRSAAAFETICSSQPCTTLLSNRTLTITALFGRVWVQN